MSVRSYNIGNRVARPTLKSSFIAGVRDGWSCEETKEKLDVLSHLAVEGDRRSAHRAYDEEIARLTAELEGEEA